MTREKSRLISIAKGIGAIGSVLRERLSARFHDNFIEELTFRLEYSMEGNPIKLGLYEMIKSNILSFEAVAFIWLAIDARLNILISGPDSSENAGLLDAFAFFLPKYETLLCVDGYKNRIILKNPPLKTVSITFPTFKVKNIIMQLNRALNNMPQRILISEMKRELARGVFGCARSKAQFMSTIQTNLDIKGLNVLMQKPYLVEASSLSALDLSVNITDKNEGGFVIDTYEYRWLSRAEIEYGDVLENSDSVVMSKTGSNYELRELYSSKVFQYYAEYKLISIPSAGKEFVNRVKLLKSAYMDSKDQAEFIENLLFGIDP